jgi:hypothetical protein
MAAQPSPSEFQPYRRVQVQAERDLRLALEATAKAISGRVARLSGTGIGAQVRRAQLSATLAAIKRMQRAMWLGTINPTVKQAVDDAEKAAESAIETMTRVAYASLPDGAAEALVRGLRLSAESGLKSDAARRKRDLSILVYRQEALHEGKVEEIIRSGIQASLSAKEMADDVYKYVSPTTPGGASYAAMRLARTEINNAFHERQLAGAKRPGVTAAKWNLSGSHKVPDKCNVYAAHGGNGEWSPDAIPDKPHPQCFCYLTYIMASSDEFQKRLAAGSFDDEIDRRTRENLARLGQKVGKIEPKAEPEAPAPKKTTRKAPALVARQPKMIDYMPAIIGPDTNANKIRRLMRQGKSRDEILASGVASPVFTNRTIDQALRDFKIPPDAFAKASPPKANVPSAARVVPVPAKTTVIPGGAVKVPTGPLSPAVKRLAGKIDESMPAKMRDRVLRVGGIQEKIVGGDVLDKRIKAVKHGITNVDAKHQGSNAIFAHADKEIALHVDLEKRAGVIAKSRCSHAKVRGGDDGIATTIAHEMGHAFLSSDRINTQGLSQLAKELTEKMGFETPAPRISLDDGLVAGRKSFEAWFKAVKGNKKDFVKIRQEVSAYAVTNTNEFLAEVWAEYTMNPHSSDLIKEVGEMMKKFITGEIKGVF